MASVAPPALGPFPLAPMQVGGYRATAFRELMDWQTVAWRRIADPMVTTFERREMRNHVKTCNDELRRCLAIKVERFCARGAVEVRGRAVNIKFRLLATEF
jgi:hypothetical protein